MSGYARWNGVNSPLMHRAPGSFADRIAFTPGIWEFIANEDDYKWYDWKSKREPNWEAKRRLASSDVSRKGMEQHQPIVDMNDPSHEQIAKRTELTEALEKAQKELNEFNKAEMMKGRKRGGK